MVVRWVVWLWGGWCGCGASGVIVRWAVWKVGFCFCGCFGGEGLL